MAGHQARAPARGSSLRRGRPALPDAVVVTVAGASGALPGTQAGTAKVTPFAEYPARAAATGGVRCHRFLKGEDMLLLAWAGPRRRWPPAPPVSRSRCPPRIPPGRFGVPLPAPVTAVGGRIDVPVPA